MYIQNVTVKSIKADGLSFPLQEGSVLTVGGVTGIVPATIDVRPATNMIYIAVAGTIDLTSPANANVSFTDQQIKALGGDFNFVPAVEVAEKKELPDYSSSNNGYFLTIQSNWIGGKYVTEPEWTSPPTQPNYVWLELFTSDGTTTFETVLGDFDTIADAVYGAAPVSVRLDFYNGTVEESETATFVKTLYTTNAKVYESSDVDHINLIAIEYSSATKMGVTFIDWTQDEEYNDVFTVTTKNVTLST